MTEIPQFIREAGMISTKAGGIAITQPRRVAAVNLAKRVAEETVTQLGGQVRKTKEGLDHPRRSNEELCL